MTPQDSLSRKHLSDDQIDAVLISGGFAGGGLEDAALSVDLAHLADCDQCRERFEQMSAPMEDFAAISMAWSERRSSTLQPVVLATAGWARPLHWGVASIALVLAAFLVSSSSHRTYTPPSLASTRSAAQMQVQSVPAVHSAAPVIQQAEVASVPPIPNHTGRGDELDRDNRMLEAIDDEWDASTPSPAESFGLHTTSGGDTTAHYAPL
jgi:hypothetical protein